MKVPLSMPFGAFSLPSPSKILAAPLCALLCALAPGLVHAEDDASETPRFGGPSHWRVLASPYTLHFHPSPEHRRVWAIGAEKQWDESNWLVGGSYFSNSFGQPSGYLYVGKRYPGVFGYAPQNVFAQWSAGLLYGYRGEFKDKVPLNYKGFSPGALISLGWEFTPKNSVTIHALGDAGLMLQFSHELR